MKKGTSYILVWMLCIFLAGCNGGADRPAAIAAFRAANAAFTDLAAVMNENLAVYPEDIVDVMRDMSAVLREHKELLESEEPLEEAALKEMITWYDAVEDWIADVKAEYHIE